MQNLRKMKITINFNRNYFVLQLLMGECSHNFHKSLKNIYIFPYIKLIRVMSNQSNVFKM